MKQHDGAARITRLSYGAGMPIDRLRPLVRRLVALGFLSEDEDDDQRFYVLTARGQEYLDAYWKLRGYLDALSAVRLDPPPRGRGSTPRRFRG